jgi:hypothetical protein
MADTHEEQLLSDLLETIARQDSQLEAPHLEARVMASVLIAPAHRDTLSRAWVLLPVAAAVVMVFTITARLKPSTTEHTARLKPSTTEDSPENSGVRSEPTVRLKPDTTTARAQGATEVAIANPSALASQASKPARRTRHAVRSVRLQPDDHPQPDEPSSSGARVTHAPIEFVPLMPITDLELTGSFQIVRVQMPSASLGVLRPPLAQPNEIIEADVLLGEDGRARAIRLNTNGSIYPWRSR